MATPSLSELLKKISEAVSADEASNDADMSDLRVQIDSLDKVIIGLLNARATCANRIGELKREQGLPIYVPERESQVLKNVQEANPGPLQDDAIRRLFERIIDETRSLERKLVQENDEESTKGRKQN